jgi:hypothetical protein
LWASLRLPFWATSFFGQRLPCLPAPRLFSWC